MKGIVQIRRQGPEKLLREDGENPPIHRDFTKKGRDELWKCYGLNAEARFAASQSVSIPDAFHRVLLCVAGQIALVEIDSKIWHFGSICSGSRFRLHAKISASRLQVQGSCSGPPYPKCVRFQYARQSGEARRSPCDFVPLYVAAFARSRVSKG